MNVWLPLGVTFVAFVVPVGLAIWTSWRPSDEDSFDPATSTAAECRDEAQSLLSDARRSMNLLEVAALSSEAQALLLLADSKDREMSA